MILHLKGDIAKDELIKLSEENQGIYLEEAGVAKMVLSSKITEVPGNLIPVVDESFKTKSDIQLASKSYQSEKRSIKLGNVEFGGDSNNSVVIGGPCSIESKDQIEQCAALMKELDVKILRAGCFKPRTSPYTFQGLGLEGLKMLRETGDAHNLKIITEVKDSSHIEEVIEYADIVQIGAKAMYDHSILKRCGKADKPILLKRGFGTTLQEFVQAAEFILSGGNSQVILCERGIRTFENNTRFTLDLCGVSFLKEYTNLPIIVDPSHAMGYRYGVSDLARASVAMGVEGILIETHPTPDVAKSDAAQQLNFDQFREMHKTLSPIAEAVGRKII